MWFELLIFIIGLAFGFLKRGKQDLWGLLRQGAIIGIILGIIFGLLPARVSVWPGRSGYSPG